MPWEPLAGWGPLDSDFDELSPPPSTFVPFYSPWATPSDSKLVVWLALVNQDFWDPPGTKA